MIYFHSLLLTLPFYHFRYIARKANISLHNLPLKAFHRHPSGSDRRHALPRKISKWEKDKKVIDYFSQLRADVLRRLYNMYKIDFEMFGYTLHPYVRGHQMT